MASRKFAELFGKYGVDNVLACWRRWMDICETELRKEIAKVPDGRYGPETDWLDDDGVDLAKPHRISASLEVKGDTLHFILDSDAQARGPINLRPCVSRNFIECLVKMIFIPAAAGERRPVAAGARSSYPPEGSLLNPRFPAPVNMYVRPSQVTTSVVMRALAQALPGRVPAPGSAAGGSLSSAGRASAQSGRWYSQYEILNGGSGARPDGDGVSAMDELVVNVMNTPVEAIETEFPVRDRALRAGRRLRRARNVPRRPRRAAAMAHPGGRIDRQPAHGPLQVFVAGRVRRQAGARLERGAQSRRRRRSAR